jgi:simple sugar transport system permease protein
MSTGTAEVAPTSKTWRRIRVGEWLVLYALSIFVALLIAGTLVEATGGDWLPVLSALLDGSVRRPGRWGETLGVAGPLLLVALGTVVSAKAGLVNIGQ